MPPLPEGRSAVLAKKTSLASRILSFFLLLAVNIALVCAVAVLAEIALRIFPPADLKSVMKGREFKKWASQHKIAEEIDSPYGKIKRLKKNFSIHVDYPDVSSYDVRTGEDRFRTVEIDPAKKKIFAIGDSLTFGYWVNDEDSWPALLDKRLKPAFPDLQVVNLATPGHSTWEEFAILKEVVPKYHPEVVIVGFSVGNDYYDNYRKRRFGSLLGVNTAASEKAVAKKNSLAQRAFDAQYHHSIRQYVKTHSYLLNLLWIRMTPTGVNQNYWTFSYPLNAKFLKGKELTRRVFHEMQKYLAQHHCRLVVAILPSKEQIDFERYEADYAKRRWRASLIDYHFPPRDKLPYYSRALAEILEAEKIPYVDLFDDFMAHKQEGLFFPADFHPSKKGYRLIAEGVGEFLQKFLPN